MTKYYHKSPSANNLPESVLNNAQKQINLCLVQLTKEEPLSTSYEDSHINQFIMNNWQEIGFFLERGNLEEATKFITPYPFIGDIETLEVMGCVRSSYGRFYYVKMVLVGVTGKVTLVNGHQRPHDITIDTLLKELEEKRAKLRKV